MKTSRFIWGLLLPLLFVSCSSVRDEGVVFEKAKVVSSFPKEITLSLSDAQDVDLGILGIADLYSHDSMLMVVTRSDEPVVEFLTTKRLSLREDSFAMVMVLTKCNRLRFLTAVAVVL